MTTSDVLNANLCFLKAWIIAMFLLFLVVCCHGIIKNNVVCF